jgi:hypothetical protein
MAAKPRAQTTKEHLICGLWPLQGGGEAALKGWSKAGGAAQARFAAKPAKAAYVTTPWGKRAMDFAGQTAVEIAESPLTGLGTFTIELWARCDDIFAGPQVLLEHVGQERDYWRVMLDERGRLGVMWFRETPRPEDRAAIIAKLSGGDAPVPMPKEYRVCQAIHLADVILPGRWYHIVVTCYEFAYLELCVTPAGKLFPQPVRTVRFGPMEWKGSAAGPLIVGGTQQKGDFFHGSICDVAVFPHAKRRNEFPSLGQRPPKGFALKADFPLSSALLPVETAPQKVTVGCRPAPYQQKSFWFYSRLERVKGKTIDLEIIPWPDSNAMLASPWVSYDRRNWRHLTDAYWCYEEPGHSGMFFKHRFTKSPAWVAVSLPYGIEEIDRLEREVAGSRYVTMTVASRSTEGRPIRLFHATDPSVPDKGKRAIYVQAGQHSPCEMLGGVALDAAVRLCARPTGTLRELLRKAILLFVPVVNQDTAYHGGSSSVACGVNLNRDWWEPRSPEVKGLKKFIQDFNANVAPIDIVTDMHAGGGWRAHTILARTEPTNEEAFRGCHATQERWLAALAANADFSPREFGRENRDHNQHPVNRGIMTTALRHQLKICAVVAELCPVVYWDRRSGRYARVTQRSMQQMGPDLLKAMGEFLGVG